MVETQEARGRIPAPVAQGPFGFGYPHAGVRAIEITNNSVGDAPVLSEMMDPIESEETLANVSVEGVYDV